MNLYEALLLAITSLKANKVRSLLTMLGIIIGISSVIGIITIGNAMSQSVSNSLSSLGGRNVYFYPASRNNSDYNDSDNMTERDLITDEMIQNLRIRYGNQIYGISLTKSIGSGKVREGTRTANVRMIGTNEDNFKVDAVELLTGRIFQEGDIKTARNITVISDRLAKKLYKGNIQASLGKEIQVDTTNSTSSFTVVGVYKYTANPMLGIGGGKNKEDEPTSFYIPITTAEELSSVNKKGYEQIIIKISDKVNAEKVTEDINGTLNKFYKNNNQFKIDYTSVANIAKQTNSALGSAKLAIAVIAGISLLVGGIGVMNIMLVSVTERTREIGIRKALGATNINILTQFIVESMIVCLIGGFIGVFLGSSLGYLGSLALHTPTFPSPLSILVAVTFSMSIGLFFGFYPANKAAKLDPIDALRYE